MCQKEQAKLAAKVRKNSDICKRKGHFLNKKAKKIRQDVADT